MNGYANIMLLTFGRHPLLHYIHNCVAAALSFTVYRLNSLTCWCHLVPHALPLSRRGQQRVSLQ